MVDSDVDADKRRKGRFIVFEGLDGAGTSTQSARLAQWLSGQGISVEMTREPSDGPLGSIARQVLDGRLKLAADVLALTFAADRLDHLRNTTNGVEKILASGRWVVCDRYMLSTLAYQMLGDVDLDWLLSINRSVIDPDVTVFIDTSPEVCVDRIASRSQRYSLYHNTSALKRTLRNYQRMIARGDGVGHLVTVDGNRSEDQVFEEIFSEVQQWLALEPDTTSVGLGALRVG